MRIAENKTADDWLQVLSAATHEAMRSRLLLASAREKTSRLSEQIARGRRQLLESKALLARAIPKTALPFQDAIPAIPEPGQTMVKTDAPERTFEAVTELIEQVKRSTGGDLDVAAWLIEDVVLAIRRMGDPAILMGILLQGLVTTMEERLPLPDRRDAAIALCSVLWDRINQDDPQPR